MPKVTLIYPQWENRGLNSIPFLQLTPQGPNQIAALTPLNWEVEIIDESKQSINFDAPTDLVGISAMSAQAPRAYEIAWEYRRRGVTTILGGVHGSVLTEEATSHFDSVVVGEADEIWPKVLDDFSKGCLEPIYRPELPKTLNFSYCRNISRINRCHSVKHPTLGVNLALLQAQRGCPRGCDYCSVTSFSGNIVRTRDIDSVLEDVEREKANGADYFFFIDDNIIGNKHYAKVLFRELISQRIKWIAQSVVNIADEEDDILDLALESGFCGVYLGLESIKSETLSQISSAKTKWRQSYEKYLSRLRKNGVLTMAGFIFGHDTDDRQIVQRTVNWTIDNHIDLIQLFVLTPLPGTKLYYKMVADNRLISYDWTKYCGMDLVYKSPVWTDEELKEEIRQGYQKFYSSLSIFKRMIGLKPDKIPYFLAMNHESRRGVI